MELYLQILFAVIVFCSVSFFIAYMTTHHTEAKIPFSPINIRMASVQVFMVILCYWLSSLGFLSTIYGATKALWKTDFTEIVFGVIWAYAWLCHAVMCWAWIANWRLAKFWPLSGTVFGVTSFLLLPIEDAIKNRNMEFIFIIKNVSMILLLEFLLVLPCFLLALYLAFFHLRNKVAKD